MFERIGAGWMVGTVNVLCVPDTFSMCADYNPAPTGDAAIPQLSPVV